MVEGVVLADLLQEVAAVVQRKGRDEGGGRVIKCHVRGRALVCDLEFQVGHSGVEVVPPALAWDVDEDGLLGCERCAVVGGHALPVCRAGDECGLRAEDEGIAQRHLGFGMRLQ